MQIKTMNKRINQTKDEMKYVLAVFRIKLDKHLRTLPTDVYSDLDCYRVTLHANECLSTDDIEHIEEKFMLKIDYYDVEYTPAGLIISVWYYFDYDK